MTEAKTNAELVRNGFAAFAEQGVEGLISMIADDFVLVTPPSLASEPDTYRGKDGLRRYFDSFYEAMEGIELRPSEFTAVGEKVVVDFTLVARGRTTGIEAARHAYMVWQLRDGLAVRVDLYPDRDEAFSAAEL
jgi:ketosteroid isomerase-like protein